MSKEVITDYTFIQDLQKLSFVDKIVLFGSRARKDNAARADIDLAIICPKASERDWINLLTIIENADTLLKIDCVRLDRLPENSPLKGNIKKEGKVIYAKN